MQNGEGNSPNSRACERRSGTIGRGRRSAAKLLERDEGAADRGEYRQAAGAFAEAVN